MTTDDKDIQVIIYKVNIFNKGAVFPQFILYKQKYAIHTYTNYIHLYIDKVSKKKQKYVSRNIHSISRFLHYDLQSHYC